MHRNFVRRKISFKSALEIFTSVSGHLRTALKYKSLKFSDFVFMKSLSTIQIKITFSNQKQGCLVISKHWNVLYSIKYFWK